MAIFVTPEEAVVLGYIESTGKCSAKDMKRLGKEAQRIAKKLIVNRQKR